MSDIPYSFTTRFEEGSGTNPEELIAAAHAGCFSMALSAELEKSDLKPEEIKTTASVTLKKTGEGFSIPSVHLSVSVKIPGASKEIFENAAKKASEGCPISKLLKATVTLDTTLRQ